MLKSLLDSRNFYSIEQDINFPSHAYLFYGEDEILNIELAKVFIASIFCGKRACFGCESCKRTEINKNPDLLILDKPNLQVADIENIINNVQLKPMVYNYKIVFVMFGDGMNETAQNKLLKTLEEPNPQVVFVICCTNIEKLLPTIRSRLKKQFVVKDDLSLVAKDLAEQGINVDKFLHTGITISDAIKYASNDTNEILELVEQTIFKLKSSSDIPLIVGGLKLKTENRKEFLDLFLKATNCALTSQQGLFSEKAINYMQATFNIKVLIKMLKLIDNAMRKLDSNVNFNYVLDELFYNILKEKYLCK